MGIKRTCICKVLLAPREKETFKKLSENNGMSLSALIRALLFEKSRERENVKRF